MFVRKLAKEKSLLDASVGCAMIQRVQVAGRSHVGTVSGELDGESGLGSDDVLERGDDVALNALRNGVDTGDVRWNGDENAEPRKVIGGPPVRQLSWHEESRVGWLTWQVVLFVLMRDEIGQKNGIGWNGRGLAWRKVLFAW